MSKKSKATTENNTDPRIEKIKPFILYAAREYLKNSHQDKVNGWDKYWCYSRPTNKYIGTLTKITFEVGKKELDTDQLLGKIQEEITKRILSGDSYFMSGFRAFTTNELFYRLECHRDHIMNELLDSKELASALEKNTEYPEINQLFQRIKDYQSDNLSHDSLLEVIRSF